MNINDSLRLLTQLFFVLLGFITTLHYFYYRGKTRRDIALMSGSLAVPFFIELLEPTTGLQSPGLDLFGGLYKVNINFSILVQSGEIGLEIIRAFVSKFKDMYRDRKMLFM